METRCTDAELVAMGWKPWRYLFNGKDRFSPNKSVTENLHSIGYDTELATDFELNDSNSMYSKLSEAHFKSEQGFTSLSELNVEGGRIRLLFMEITDAIRAQFILKDVSART